VNTFYRSCNGHASCNCGVAIKIGNHVIVFDKCEKSALEIRAYIDGNLTPGAHVVRIGHKFRVSNNFMDFLK